MIRVLFAAFALSFASSAFAGHTRPAYLDGGQSADGRYVVTAEPIKETVGKKEAVKWKYTWKDTKENVTHSGWLKGPRGLGHFDVTYGHLFVPPGGETFALFLPASWAEYTGPGPSGHPSKTPDSASHPAFGSRLTIYKKTGEIVKTIDAREILKPHEWIYVTWVQGNLYWLKEYPDVMKGGEPPRVGWRYYRISPDYSTLEMTIGAGGDVVHKVKDEPKEVQDYSRVVRVRLADGAILDPAQPLGKEQTPVRPFCDDVIRRELAGRYRASLDPVRQKGTYVEAGEK